MLPHSAFRAVTDSQAAWVEWRRPGVRSLAGARWLLLGVLALACAGAPGDTAIPAADEAFERDVAPFADLAPAHRLTLAASEEPGRRLLVFGRLVDRSGLPLPDRAVRFFHTNAAGSYEERVAGDETTARLSGSLRTGPEGRYVLSTILPGDYGGAEGGHIHTEVAGADPLIYDFHFSQFMGYALRRWAEGSSVAVILELHARGDTLVAVSDLPVRPAPDVEE